MEQKKLTKTDLRKVFLRSLTIMCSWNYERQMHMGFINYMQMMKKEKKMRTDVIWNSLTVHLR